MSVLIELVRVARTALALAAILPGFFVGVLVLVSTRDRRRGANAAYRLWGSLGTRAAGIRLEVQGEHYLWSARPCVFLINHQSGVDPIILAALLKRDFAGVAKKELRRNPVLGPAFAVAGAVFVDRFDTAQAIRALAPAIDALRSGISIAIAPEGTRARDQGLGRFKKGGFRLAIAAGVPLVPVVICNSRDVLPRHGWLMKAGTVRIVVHPPISTDGWHLDDIDERVEEVRRVYERTLASRAAGDGAVLPGAPG